MEIVFCNLRFSLIFEPLEPPLKNSKTLPFSKVTHHTCRYRIRVIRQSARLLLHPLPTPFPGKSSIPSIEARAAVNQRDDFGQSALWLACRFGRRDHVNPLLEAKVPPGGEDKQFI